ncbi:MAG TPA: methylenetetrahydrofolate reductase [NAD(P)H] [Candidatus Sphingobacterium stercoripullorum]|uniref:Methylenetetrahydrofolate reductase n=1 Tax=Candidatus Sphingobacterium stercoripullorum TaxID=2838759 RepID=A0A9D1WAS8_9SPHI|nr:methylenetetrahydrofolate reductase [NAD(P)H] [Candidatus Sphingobacterium stercoripullorum]HLR50869.1 methylenetetrahydrofolate reductase [NAD(P)H] [Candidatus Sphingobacterium stercoripullorum]
MKIVDHIQNAKGKTLFSFELLPPSKGQGIETIFQAIDPLMEFNPPFIDVTYHREDYIYKERANGLLEKVAYRRRPGTVAICAAIMNKYKVDAVPHLICGGFTKEETENALIDLNFLGIDNVLVLRGDARKGDSHFIPTPGGHAYASDLLGQVKSMNEGAYLYEEVAAHKTDFCIGVAGYPEKHFEAPNFNTDFKYLKMKVEMGAEFIVTQMFFNNKKYFEFVEKCRDHGITVPIIPGLKPLTTKRQLITLPRIFHLDIPEELSSEVELCKNNDQVRELGVEWLVQQCKELMDFGVPVLHFYTMSNPEPTRKIASQLF